MTVQMILLPSLLGSFTAFATNLAACASMNSLFVTVLLLFLQHFGLTLVRGVSLFSSIPKLKTTLTPIIFVALKSITKIYRPCKNKLLGYFRYRREVRLLINYV